MALLTTGIIALGRKYNKHQAQRKEARQGQLELGDRDVARNAFMSQVSATQDRKLIHPATDVLWDSPGDITASDRMRDGADDTAGDDAASSLSSKDLSAHAVSARTSEHLLDNPPPYSPASPSPARTTPPLDLASQQHTMSSGGVVGTMPTTGSPDTPHAVRVYTAGSDLKSGFPYHPALFDLRVRPDDWDRFTHDISEATKFDIGDHAKLWASATSVALTGALITSVWVGKTMNRSLQEKKVKSGLADMSDGGLGDTLQQWNETHFKQLGLFAHLEVHKRPEQKPKLSKRMSRNTPKEERERKKAERKFVIVMTTLDAEGVPAAAMQELDATDKTVELPVQDDARSFAVELPGDGPQTPVEMQDTSAPARPEPLQPLGKIVELPAEVPADLGNSCQTIDDKGHH